MKSMSGCFSALGGWLARHHEKKKKKSHAVVYLLMLCHVTLRVAAEAPGDMAQRDSNSETLHELRFVPGCGIFHPLCINRKKTEICNRRRW